MSSAAVLCTISNINNHFITGKPENTGRPVLCARASSGEDQQWQLERQPEGGCTIKNALTGLYLTPAQDEYVLLSEKPHLWQLSKNADETFTISTEKPGTFLMFDEERYLYTHFSRDLASMDIRFMTMNVLGDILPGLEPSAWTIRVVSTGESFTVG